MKLTRDRYRGIVIDYTGYSDFEAELGEILGDVTDERLLWITIKIEDSELIPLLTEKQFIFYDCNEVEITLVKKLIPEPVMPTPTNHTLGVGGAIIDGDQLLVIKDRFHDSYKLPGGHIDPREHISETLAREVKEETGVEAVFESVVAMGHFFPGQFGESNLYIVCRGRALDKTINIIDSEEVVEAKWVNIDEYLADENNFIFNRRIVAEALKGGGLVLDQRELPSRFDFSREIFIQRER